MTAMTQRSWLDFAVLLSGRQFHLISGSRPRMSGTLELESSLILSQAHSLRWPEPLAGPLPKNQATFPEVYTLRKAIRHP